MAGVFNRGFRFGDLFGVSRRTVEPETTAGVPGFSVFGGRVDQKERNPNLVGEKRYVTYSNILTNVSIVGASARYFLNLLSKATWKVEPADETDEAKRLADEVQFIMEDMRTPWARVVRRAAMYRYFGFSVQEWTAKRREDGTIGMMDIMPRPQHTIEQWDVAEDGEIRGVVQRSPQTSELLYLPRRKVVYVCDDSLSDSPEGLGLFRHLAEPADRLCNYEKLEGYGFETDLRGIPIGRAPINLMNQAIQAGTMNASDAQALISALESFVANHIKNPDQGLVLDSAPYLAQDEAARPVNVPQWDINQLEIDNADSAAAIMNAIERLNREMARLQGTEHLLLGGDGQGSLALSRDKTQNFGLIIDSSLGDLEESMDDDFLDPLFMLNGWDPALKPRLKTEQVRFRDIEQVTQALRDMADAGSPLQAGDPIIDEVRDILGLSKQPQDLVQAAIDAASLNMEMLQREASGANDPAPEPTGEDE